LALKWRDIAFKLVTVGVNMKLLKYYQTASRNEDMDILIMIIELIMPKLAGRGRLDVKVTIGEENG
jgi:hypothetical protein